MLIDETDKAWSAGFFDGEGSITIFETKPNANGYTRFGIRMSVTQVNVKPLEKLYKMYGGSIHGKKYRQRNPKWQKCFYWTAYGNELLKFLIDIEPYLIVKKKQVNIGIIFLERRSGYLRGGRQLSGEEWDKDHQDMRKLLSLR